MAQPLATFLAVLLAFSAWAVPAQKTPQQLKAALTQGFAKGEDLSALDFSGQAELAKLAEQAKYVQGGREPDDEKETYLVFIKSVARRLGVSYNVAVPLYGDRVREKRGSAPGKNEIDARAEIALDVKRNPGIPQAKKDRMSRDARATSAALRSMIGDPNFVADPQRPATLNVSHRDVTQDSIARDVSYNSDGTRNWSRLPPRVQPVAYTPGEKPPVPLQSASAGMMSWSTLASYFDWEKGKQVAAEAFTGTLNYVKKMGRMCYMFVKQALIDAGVIDAPNPQSTGLVGLRPGAAKMFSQDVKKRPKILDEMGYRQVDLAKISDDPATVPDGSMLVYAGGCSFADPDNGHAEITVGDETYRNLRAKNVRLREIHTSANEIRVCHFSCTKRSMPYLRTYGKQGCLKMYVPVKSS